VQQLNHSSSLNFANNEWQSCHIEYSLNNQSNQSQWTHQNELFHQNNLSSSWSAYFIKLNESYKSNNNNSNHNDDNLHLISYYADQNNKTSQSQFHNNDYVHKAITRCVYKCNECSVIFSIKNQFTYYIHENHYIYFTSTYHLAVISIDHIIIKTSLEILNTDVTLICLDFEVLHILVNCILIVVFISQISEIL